MGINGSPDVSDIWNVPFDNSQNSFVVQHIENLSKHLSCSYHKNQTSSILKCPSNVLHLIFLSPLLRNSNLAQKTILSLYHNFILCKSKILNERPFVTNRITSLNHKPPLCYKTPDNYPCFYSCIDYKETVWKMLWIRWIFGNMLSMSIWLGWYKFAVRW